MTEQSAPAPQKMPRAEITRFPVLPVPLKVIVLILWAGGIMSFIWYLWGWVFFGFVLEDVQYYFIIYLCFASPVYLCLPFRKKERGYLPWYDIVLFAMMFGICVFYIWNAHSIARILWVPPPYLLALILPGITMLLALEGGRRMAGPAYVGIKIVAGTFPLYCEYLPGLLYGVGQTLEYIVAAFAYGRMGMLGIPAQVTGELLIGFLMFAGVLIASGAGEFFLNFALALMGRFRGGPAKVAVLASGMFGSLSGSSISNVIATGSVTIPTMKRVGYPPHYAGGIEAVASSGGSIMPPVMGSTAFLLAILTGIPYSFICVAAFIPALLYYWGLLVQVDSYAARIGLRGLPKAEIPSLWKTLKEGWPFIFVLFFLVFALLYLRWEARSPIFASALMILLSYTRRETWMTPRKLLSVLATVGGLITYLMAVLLTVGILLLGIQITGTLTALTQYIIGLGEENMVLIMAIAALVCYLMGMVGMAIVPYIVLAVTAVPSIAVATGLPVLAIHLFVIFFLISAPITPPVCVTAFTAAALAGARPFKTGFTAMRMAIVLYFIPWCFVYEPALILKGNIIDTIIFGLLAIAGVWVIASGMEGYLLKFGRLDLWARPFVVIGGFLIAFPEWMTTIGGAALMGLLVAVLFIRKKTGAVKLTTVE